MKLSKFRCQYFNVSILFVLTLWFIGSPFFSQLGHLKTHKLSHTGEKEFACTQCDKVFSQLGHLMRHKLTHTGEKEFAFTQCDKTFSESGTLKRHKLSPTGDKEFICTQCDKVFSQSCHTSSPTPEKNKFVLTICDKALYISRDLNKHKLIHAGKKPFVCT